MVLRNIIIYIMWIFHQVLFHLEMRELTYVNCKELEVKDNVYITDSAGNKSNKLEFGSTTVCLTNS